MKISCFYLNSSKFNPVFFCIEAWQTQVLGLISSNLDTYPTVSFCCLDPIRTVRS